MRKWNKNTKTLKELEMRNGINNNKTILELDNYEFGALKIMFDNLKQKKRVSCEFREFGSQQGEIVYQILPMHLCRIMGEINNGVSPFASTSLYNFWKYGFEIGGDSALKVLIKACNPHGKAVAAYNFGIAFCAWAMESVFHCETWVSATALIENGAVFPDGTENPDFVCTFDDDSLGIFKAWGTSGTERNLICHLCEYKKHLQGISADSPIKTRVVVGTALEGETKVVLLDPEPTKTRPSNLNVDLVRRTARKMRQRSFNKIVSNDDIRRMGVVIPSENSRQTENRRAYSSFPAPIEIRFRNYENEIILKYDRYREDKRHGWLEVRLSSETRPSKSKDIDSFSRRIERGLIESEKFMKMKIF